MTKVDDDHLEGDDVFIAGLVGITDLWASPLQLEFL